MRSRIRIQGELLTEARNAAAASGLTLSNYVEEAIRRQIIEGPCTDAKPPTELQHSGGEASSHDAEVAESGELLELLGSA